tara:strand:+ start:195 stop:488 length:294 start_codon:yes stop_codon:yes gene_type:complete
MVNFEIVEPHYDGQDYWIFDSLEEAKDAGIAYLEEQDADRVNSDDGIIYPRTMIRRITMEILWDEFWKNYTEERKLVDNMTDEEYEKIDNRIKGEGK